MHPHPGPIPVVVHWPFVRRHLELSGPGRRRSASTRSPSSKRRPGASPSSSGRPGSGPGGSPAGRRRRCCATFASSVGAASWSGSGGRAGAPTSGASGASSPTGGRCPGPSARRTWPVRFERALARHLAPLSRKLLVRGLGVGGTSGWRPRTTCGHLGFSLWICATTAHAARQRRSDLGRCLWIRAATATRRGVHAIPCRFLRNLLFLRRRTRRSRSSKTGSAGPPVAGTSGSGRSSSRVC